MIDPHTFGEQSAALEKALEAKLRLRGRTLDARLRKAGRLLPGRVRRAGRVLTEAQVKLAHPKLSRQVDDTRVSHAFTEFDTYLETIDPADRRKGAILGWLGGLVFNLIVVFGLLILVLRWQGLV